MQSTQMHQYYTTLNVKPQTKEWENLQCVLVIFGWLAKQKNELGLKPFK
jgi:hypothetical protein